MVVVSGRLKFGPRREAESAPCLPYFVGAGRDVLNIYVGIEIEIADYLQIYILHQKNTRSF
jgi:hypothetical protein